MVAGAAAWMALVLGAAATTNIFHVARLCDETTVSKPETVEERGGPSNLPTLKTTRSTSTTTTKKCGGVTVPQAAVLLAPGLLFFAPALTTLNVAGLFSVTFREVRRKLDEQRAAVDHVASEVREIKTKEETAVKVRDDGRSLREGEAQVGTVEGVPFNEVLGDVAADESGVGEEPLGT
jgi:hypothetical protein